MKKILLLGFLLAFISCSKDSTPDEESARYYVKYEVTFITQHLTAIRYITFTNEEGFQTIEIKDNEKTITWDQTYGPVDKNFVPSLKCDVVGPYASSIINAKISLSRNGEPFVVKAEGSNAKSVLLRYEIDF